MSSNKELLKLENDLRDEIPKYSERPDIIKMHSPRLLGKRVKDFLLKTSKPEKDVEQYDAVEKSLQKLNVEMDVYMVPSDED